MDSTHLQTTRDLAAHLEEQLGFLHRSASAFDEGFDSEAKRLAVTLRVLLHDTGASRSLLGQLNRLDASFISTALPYDPANLHTHWGLIFATATADDPQYVAMLDEVFYWHWSPFQEWWNEVIFKDDRAQFLTRKQLVTSVADQDGGAHVDPTLNEIYARLSRENSLGWTASDGISTVPIQKPERAAIRQIAHEVLKTLISDYSCIPPPRNAIIIGGPVVKPGTTVSSLPTKPRIHRNKPCPCGSGKKYKRCHLFSDRRIRTKSTS